MKKLYLLSLFFLAKISFAQFIECMPAKDAGVKNFPNLSGFFTKENGGIFHSEIIEKDKKYTYILEKFNNDLTPMFKQTIAFENGESVQCVEIKQNKIFLFTTYYNDQDNTLFLRILDNASGKTVLDKRILGALPSDRFGVSGRTFSVEFSPDETKMLIVSAFQWPKKPQQVKAEIYETASLKILNSFNFPDAYNEIIIKTTSYNLTNDGNMLYFFKPDVKEKKAPKRTTLGFYEANSKTNKFADLPLESKIIDNFYSSQKEGSLIMAGVFKDDYPKKDDKENKAGIFSIVLNTKNGTVSNSKFEYFSAETDKKLSYKDGEGNKDLSEKKFSAKGMIKTKNGFYIIENLTYTRTSEGKYATYITQFSREYVVSKIDETGKIEFIKIIPKYTSKNMYDGDFMESNNNLYLFYGDHPKNLEKFTLENYEPKEYDDVADVRGPVAVCVKVAANGTLSRQNIFRNETWCYYPGYGVITKNGSDMVVMTIQKDEYLLQVFRVKP